MPGCQSVLNPFMRWYRTSTSSIAQVSACPMCSDPVTLGGGIGSTYVGRVSAGSLEAAKTLFSIQYAYQRGSTSRGS